MPSTYTLGPANQGDPAYTAVLPTQSDTVDDPGGPFRYISIGVLGALKVRTFDGDDVVIPSGSLAIGIMHPLRVKRVWTTGTAATGIVGYK